MGVYPFAGRARLYEGQFAMTITPDPQDYASVEREHGRLPVNASDLQCAEHYRLAQATKLIRLWEQGKLPLPKMRAMDRLKRAAP